MTVTAATPEILWALLRMSPRRAAAVESNEEVAHDESVQALSPVRWRADAGELEVSPFVLGNYAYHFVRVVDASPTAVRALVLDRGIHLRAAMVRDGLWRGMNRPIEGFVVVAVELDLSGNEVDRVSYILGDEIESAGQAAYHQALARFRSAQDSGWPGWSARGMLALE